MAKQMEDNLRIGIDVGGTFTDFVVYDPEQRSFFENKVLTTPSRPTEAILAGLKTVLIDAGVSRGALEQATIIHGTTLITNALITRSGKSPALITTYGAGDIIETGKGYRYDPYDRLLERPAPLVPRPLRKMLHERVLADGSVYKELNEAEVKACFEELLEEGVAAAAICLLHSYANRDHEQRIKAIAEEMGLQLYLSLSSDIAPELGEYERMNTTAANAYIQPIAEGYLAELQEALQDLGHQGAFYLMWSDGGLASVEVTLQAPIRLLESGPAAGALAVRHFAKSMEVESALAFDMGGTTAKICLIQNGEPSRSPSFEIGRVHRNKPGSGTTVKVPSIHMLEMGAGGGSIGRVDELGFLKVGPKSAGATPGPASYNQGGEDPTVTDANLFLGYLSEEATLAGGLKLNKAKAEEALAKVGAKAGLSPYEVAVGIRRIINENMAQAAQLHVTESGEDPREFTLLAFGGAAPLHAFDIAKALGIRQVILPRQAGVLSAFGFLTAQVGFEQVQSYLSSVPELDIDDLLKLVDELREKAITTLSSGGVASQEMRFDFSLDMRYRGQGYDIQVSIDPTNLDADVLEKAFRQAYSARYGQGQDGVVEVSACRLSAQGPEPELAASKEEDKETDPQPTAKRKLWFAEQDAWLEAQVMKLEQLSLGQSYQGPLVIEAPHTSYVAGPGGHLTLNDDGDLIMHVPESQTQLVAQGELSPVDLEIITARLRAIADEADHALLKTAFSSAVRDGKDYSLVISDPQGRCIAMPTACMPLFVTCMPRTIGLITEIYPPASFKPGDIVMTNDPWLGAGHKSDVALIAPLFKDNELVAFIGTILHVADVGGTLGDFRAWDIYEEGLMLPPCKLYEEGQINSAVEAIIKSNVRVPEMVFGDINAMRTAIEVISKRLSSMLEHSDLNLTQVADEISGRARSAFVECMREIPQGDFYAELDADGILEGNEEMRKPIHLALKAKMDGDELVLDFTGTDLQRPRQAINVPISYTLADAIYAMQYMIAPEVPNIGPQFSPIRVHAPEGTILNAQTPVPVFARTRTGIHISTLVHAALAEAVPDKTQAGCGHNIIFRVVGNRKDGSYFSMTFMPKGGMGATGGRDGWDCTVYPTNCTMIATEVAETRSPVLIEREIAQDSAGPGRERGGSGQIVRLMSLSDEPLTLGFRPNFIEHPPMGLLKGQAGAPAFVEVKGSREREDPVVLNKGEWVRVRTAGGGGIGNPLTRPLEKVEEDWVAGIISTEHARRVYGAMFSDGALDYKASQHKRRRETTG
ncbi:MAG: hydantoinase B/oxoprolinase family protein [Chloroflexota bacterium]